MAHDPKKNPFNWWTKAWVHSISHSLPISHQHGTGPGYLGGFTILLRNFLWTDLVADKIIIGSLIESELLLGRPGST